jgi:2-polyprenyl-3-methyl-5-hydroxy-6-metoxy-1,4-benzoquinol methylase
MPRIKLQLLDTPAGECFEKQVSSYRKYMSEDVHRFPELIEEIKKTGEDTEYLERYSTYMKWGVRKLEYSFVLDNLLPTDGMRILDVGSGVTILPHLLSKMGGCVEALDPALDWMMVTGPTGQLYNRFYRTDVAYINDPVFSIEGEGLYDSVISVSVLEHLPPSEIGRTLDKIFTLLKRGGKLIMTIDYSPGVSCTRFNLLHKMIIKLRRVMGLKIKTGHGGFSFTDFCSIIYKHLPGLGELTDLWHRDRSATSYRDFWSSHSFKGCLYDDYRPYLALGICCVKPERKEK